VTLPRGFKANAEREAVGLRREMGLPGVAPIDIHHLAEQLNVVVVSAERLIDPARLEELERMQAFAFSAATFDIRGRSYIVTNPLRSPGRPTSDVAHELSHLLLEHELTEVRELDGVPFRPCRPDEVSRAAGAYLRAVAIRPRRNSKTVTRSGVGGGSNPGETSRHAGRR
jgi:IrrE N-terminal-like domain